MIIDAIITFLIGLLNGFLSLLPQFALPDSFFQLTNTLGSTLGAWSGIFPVGALAITAGVLVAVRLFLSALWLFNWVYSLLPFKMT